MQGTVLELREAQKCFRLPEFWQESMKQETSCIEMDELLPDSVIEDIYWHGSEFNFDFDKFVQFLEHFIDD